MSEQQIPQIVTDPSAFGKVAVLLGGLSSEREISLKSGQAVHAALLSQGVDAHAVDVGRDVLRVLAEGKFDRAFIVLHGAGGEDGTLQGALQILGLPYTGSGVLGSALGMDKVKSKQVWQGMGLPTPRYQVANTKTTAEGVMSDLGLPLIIKPSTQGSSIGMAKVEEAHALHSALQAAAEYDDEVLIEQWVQGAEYTVAVLGEQALPVIKLETPRTFYDYEAKYHANDTQYLCPCGLDAKTETAYQQLALKAFNALGCHGWGRVDLMVDEQGQAWLLEVNTVPGMTDHSLVPMAAKAANISFEQLVWRILETSLEQRD